MNLRVKEICKEQNLTLSDLADMLGINRVNLSSTINGNPTIGTLEKIATALGVELVELFERKGDFVALVSVNGANHRFDNIEALLCFIDSIQVAEIEE